MVIRAAVADESRKTTLAKPGSVATSTKRRKATLEGDSCQASTARRVGSTSPSAGAERTGPLTGVVSMRKTVPGSGSAPGMAR